MHRLETPIAAPARTAYPPRTLSEHVPAFTSYPVPGVAVVWHEHGPHHENVALTVARLTRRGLHVIVSAERPPDVPVT